MRQKPDDTWTWWQLREEAARLEADRVRLKVGCELAYQALHAGGDWEAVREYIKRALEDIYDQPPAETPQ